MTWQWVTLIIAFLSFIAVLTAWNMYLQYKRDTATRSIFTRPLHEEIEE